MVNFKKITSFSLLVFNFIPFDYKDKHTIFTNYLENKAYNMHSLFLLDLDPKTNKYILCFDDARFFNHSDNPNCIDTESPDDSEGYCRQRHTRRRGAYLQLQRV